MRGAADGDVEGGGSEEGAASGVGVLSRGSKSRALVGGLAAVFLVGFSCGWRHLITPSEPPFLSQPIQPPLSSRGAMNVHKQRAS